METPLRTRPVLGIDVGKRSRWACLVTAEEEIALNAPVANRERDLDELLSRAPGDALVVVDQVRNIGLLALRRAARDGARERLPARDRDARGLEAVRRGREDRREGRARHRQDGDRHTRLAPARPAL